MLRVHFVRGACTYDFVKEHLYCIQVGQGAGYVYMHQGCCEHLVELSDVRSIHHAELLQSQPTAYPLVLREVWLLSFGQKVVQYCSDTHQFYFYIILWRYVALALSRLCSVVSTMPVLRNPRLPVHAAKIGCACVQALRQRRDCAMCKMANIDRRAEWVTHNDRNAPTDPAFWCGDCYRQMHKDEGGDACYEDYKAYSYMYEFGNLKQNQGRPGSADSAPEGADILKC